MIFLKIKNKIKDWIKGMFSEATSKGLVIIGLFLIFISVVIVIFKENIFLTNEKIDSEKIGQFGDFIGGLVGSIWALAGVIMFYVALKVQQKDYSLQLKQIAQTNDEFRIQNSSLEQQRNDNIFFSLLENHRRLIDGMSESVNRHPLTTKSTTFNYTGSEVIRNNVDTLKKTMKSQLELIDSNVGNEKLYGSEHILTILKENNDFIQVYENIHHIATFIKNKFDDDVFYHQTLYKTLSMSERYVLSIYSDHSEGVIPFYGVPDFKQFIYNYILPYYEGDKYDTPPGYQVPVVSIYFNNPDEFIYNYKEKSKLLPDILIKNNSVEELKIESCRIATKDQNYITNNTQIWIGKDVPINKYKTTLVSNDTAFLDISKELFSLMNVNSLESWFEECLKTDGDNYLINFKIIIKFKYQEVNFTVEKYVVLKTLAEMGKGDIGKGVNITIH